MHHGELTLKIQADILASISISNLIYQQCTFMEVHKDYTKIRKPNSL
jgi:hypothetical protein